MNTSEQEQDAELRALFETMMKEGRLVDYVVDLLARSDGMDIQINGVSVSFRQAGFPINDRSCYKKCLREDTRNPGSYAECIKKCRPKPQVDIAIPDTLA
jgi:hypothetical protein